MINASGWEAVFTDRKHGHQFSRPLICWVRESNGSIEGYFAGERGVISAECMSNFVRYRQTDPPVIAVLPGQGWESSYECEDGGIMPDPILCWLVRADGQVDPVSVDGTGVGLDPTESANFAAISPVGGWPKPRHAPKQAEKAEEARRST